ncbi:MULTISPECIES: sulfite exporter TauE/SafE family protein [Sporosarcina]|uniref:sulfite exporter TauE/SafE family protein n=1 Tax=Sporosarcina TaxID=1569 RepID=UPI00058DD02B|nr:MULTISPECIES: sulfite exporter TauE/SafE family protein [Sporosarcina]WJY28294.1 sulfite exporter TauE/SafE family protein [Sporosarcina sp. 0.2-SM1T-5]
MEEWLLLLLVVLLASLLQAVTGFGFSILGTPVLLILFPAHMAIQVNIILSICLSALMIKSIHKEMDKTLFVRLLKGSTVGLLVGIFIYLYADIWILKLATGTATLFLTALLLLKWTTSRSAGKDALAGSISGILTTSIGVPGPPLLLYFAGTQMDKSVLRSTTLAFYLVVYTVSLVMQILFGGTQKETWIASAAALPALLGGIVLGQLLFKYLNVAMFQVITYILLAATGISLIFTSL